MSLKNTSSTFILLLLFVSCNQQVASKNPTSTVKKSEQVLQKPNLAFESMIYSIMQDREGNYWFGSHAEGACKYDGNTFTYFTKEDGLSNNQIRAIKEDTKGHIWFSTGYGICKYDGDSITRQNAVKNFLPQTAHPNDWKKTPDDLWFNGEIDGGVYRYDGQYFHLLKFPNLPADLEYSKFNGTVTGMCEGKNNMLWIANYNWVLGYNGKEFIDINEVRFQYHIRTIFEDSKGRLWIGNNGIGVLMYDGNTTQRLSDLLGQKKQSNFIEDIYPTTPMHVFTIAEDKHGNIWIGDRDTGVWKYDGTTLKNYTQKDGLPNTFVRVIYQDNEGELWFGLADGLVCKFDGNRFEAVFE